MSDLPDDTVLPPLSSPHQDDQLLDSHPSNGLSLVPHPLEEVSDSHENPLPDISDLLPRPKHRKSRSPVKPKTERKRRVRGYKSNSLFSPVHYAGISDSRVSQSNASFYPSSLEKETGYEQNGVKLKDLTSIYSIRLPHPKVPVTPPHYYRDSLRSPRKHKEPSPHRRVKSSTKETESKPSEPRFQSQLPTINASLLPREINPIRLKSHVSKSPKASRQRRDRVTSSVDDWLSPYNIRYIKPIIKKNFRLLVDLDFKSNYLPPGITVKRVGKRREGRKQDQDKEVFKTLNSLL